MTASQGPGRLPAITLTESIADRLSELAAAASPPQAEVAEYLERELDRARIVPDDQLPGKTVTIGSRVTFLDVAAEQQHTVTVVWPKDGDITLHRMSVLTPVGAALIGLKAGQGISWKNRAGLWRRLTVEAVVEDPEAAAFR